MHTALQLCYRRVKLDFNEETACDVVYAAYNSTDDDNDNEVYFTLATSNSRIDKYRTVL